LGADVAKILIVDDDALLATLMKGALAARGHEVELAVDGVKGVRAFTASRFDAVICDIVMPEQEGVETIQQLRRLRADVVIVAVSGGLGATADLDVLALVSMLGADTAFRKPFAMSALCEAIEVRLRTPVETQGQRA
jgi:DNA-binding response OmpR family regulator